MRITTLAQELISVQPMSMKEYKKFVEERENECAKLEITFTRQVLFEKHSWTESSRVLRKMIDKINNK